MQHSTFGRSWQGNDLEYITLGRGEQTTLLIGGFSAADDVTPTILRSWAEEAEECYENRGKFGDFNIVSLFGKITVYIIPEINPDGKIIRQGIDAFSPFYERCNRIKNNFPKKEWTANIRGVDLEKNFGGLWVDAKMRERTEGIFTASPQGYGGEFPESELETSSLCHFIRRKLPNFICILNNNEKGVYLTNTAVDFKQLQEKSVTLNEESRNIDNLSMEYLKTKRKAELISRLKNIPLHQVPTAASAASLPYWAAMELGIQSFSIGVKGLSDLRDIITLSSI